MCPACGRLVSLSWSLILLVFNTMGQISTVHLLPINHTRGVGFILLVNEEKDSLCLNNEITSRFCLKFGTILIPCRKSTVTILLTPFKQKEAKTSE